MRRTPHHVYFRDADESRTSGTFHLMFSSKSSLSQPFIAVRGISKNRGDVHFYFFYYYYYVFFSPSWLSHFRFFIGRSNSIHSRHSTNPRQFRHDRFTNVNTIWIYDYCNLDCSNFHFFNTRFNGNSSRQLIVEISKTRNRISWK